jgi:hypothetical protein
MSAGFFNQRARSLVPCREPDDASLVTLAPFLVSYLTGTCRSRSHASNSSIGQVLTT